MKYLLLTLTLVLCLGISQSMAQNPYKAQGVEVTPLTLSKGKYNEFFTNDTLVQIGSVLFNTRTSKIVKILEPDTSGIPLPQPGTSSRFLSIDPLAAKYPSISPYTYVANNPIIAFDPDGKDIWFVHGTFSNPNTWNENFNALRAWEIALNDRIHGRDYINIEASKGNFRWSGANYQGARTSAAERLAEQIAIAKDKSPEMLVQLVAHSHGGNVSIEAANILKEKYGITVDELILLGTPSTDDFQLIEGAVKNLTNVYNENDLVQIFGGYDTPIGAGIKMLGRFASRNRNKKENAVEINVTVVGATGSFEAHTTIHNTKELIDYISKILNEE